MNSATGGSSFGRVLNIFDYSLASLLRKGYRNGVIFFVFSLVVFFFSSFQLMTRGVTEVALDTLSTAPDITIQQMSAGRQVDIALSSKEKLKSIFGISGIEPRIWGYYFDESNGANYCVVGMDLVGEIADYKDLVTLSQNRSLDSLVAGEVVLGHKVKELLQLGERKRFSLFRPDLSQASFTTVGVFNDTLDPVTGDFIYMSLATARDLFAVKESFVTDLLVSVANPAEIDTVARKISEELPGTRVITKKQMLKTYKVAFGWRSGLGLLCMLSSLVTFIILAWDKATGFSKDDEREMSILKLLGWQTSDIVLLRFLESVSVSLLAFFTGYLLAWLHIIFADGYLFRPVFLGWSILKPSFPVTPTFVASDLFLVFVISVIPYLCATIVPAWRSGNVRAETGV